MRPRAFAIAVSLAVGLLATALPARGVEVGGIELPPALTVGDQHLSLSGCGERSALLINIYVAGLYLPRPGLGPSDILASHTPKAVQLTVVYPGTMPEKLPKKWRRPLKHMAPQEIRDAIQYVYSQVRPGDRLTIMYTPELGTIVDLNGRRILDWASDDLIQPMLRLWIGEEAESKDLRAHLLSGRCEESRDWFDWF